MTRKEDTLSSSEELQKLIYGADESKIIDFLAKIDISSLSSNHDFLSYPIKRKLNNIVRILLHVANVNVRANDSIALSVAKSCGNKEANSMIRDILSDPICDLIVRFWDSAEIKKSKVYRYSRTSTLQKYLDKTVYYPYKIMIDGFIIDDPQESLPELLSISGNTQERITKNITICISVGGETYPSEKITVLANMVEWLLPEQINKIWEDKNVVRDGTIKRLIELRKDIPKNILPDKDDIDYLYQNSKLQTCIDRFSMEQLIKVARRSILEDNHKNLILIYKSRNWIPEKTLFNPYVLAIEHASLFCLKASVEYSKISTKINDDIALKTALKLEDKDSEELLSQNKSDSNPLDGIPDKLTNKDRLLNLTFSDMSVFGSATSDI